MHSQLLSWCLGVTTRLYGVSLGKNTSSLSNASKTSTTALMSLSKAGKAVSPTPLSVSLSLSLYPPPSHSDIRGVSARLKKKGVVDVEVSWHTCLLQYVLLYESCLY